jgi:hypothetical protein
MINYAPDNPIARLLDAPPHHQMTLKALMRGRSLNQNEIDRFGGLGVKAIDLSNPWSMQVDRVAFYGDFFQFADDGDVRGVQVITMGVMSEEGLIDALAWHPPTDRLAVLSGLGFALSEYRIGDHIDHRSAGLAVFRSPMDWLRAGCDGIVIVRKAFAHIVLAKVPVLIAEDESHGVELRQMFTAGGTGPDVVVRAPTDADSAVKLEVAA